MRLGCGAAVAAAACAAIAAAPLLHHPRSKHLIQYLARCTPLAAKARQDGLRATAHGTALVQCRSQAGGVGCAVRHAPWTGAVQPGAASVHICVNATHPSYLHEAVPRPGVQRHQLGRCDLLCLLLLCGGLPLRRVALAQHPGEVMAECGGVTIGWAAC